MSTKPGAVTSRLIHSSKEQTLRQYQTEAASLTCDTGVLFFSIISKFVCLFKRERGRKAGRIVGM